MCPYQKRLPLTDGWSVPSDRRRVLVPHREISPRKIFPCNSLTQQKMGLPVRGPTSLCIGTRVFGETFLGRGPEAEAGSCLMANWAPGVGLPCSSQAGGGRASRQTDLKPSGPIAGSTALNTLSSSSNPTGQGPPKAPADLVCAYHSERERAHVCGVGVQKKLTRARVVWGRSSNPKGSAPGLGRKHSRWAIVADKHVLPRLARAWRGGFEACLERDESHLVTKGQLPRYSRYFAAPP